MNIEEELINKIMMRVQKYFSYDDLPNVKMMLFVSYIVMKFLKNRNTKLLSKNVRRIHKMSQFVIINGTEYECKASSELHYLLFSFTDKTADEVKNIFTDVTSLMIAGEDKVVYGTYENLKLASVEEVFNNQENDDSVINAITVVAKMYIKTQMEVDVDNLKETQNEQDELIAELLYGA